MFVCIFQDKCIRTMYVCTSFLNLSFFLHMSDIFQMNFITTYPHTKLRRKNLNTRLKPFLTKSMSKQVVYFHTSSKKYIRRFWYQPEYSNKSMTVFKFSVFLRKLNEYP